jgi:NAD+ kinase
MDKTNINYYVIDAKSFVAPQDIDFVISVGGDGTLLSASHNLNNQIPILGVNSDPTTSVGFFCTSTTETFYNDLSKILDSTIPVTELTRMKIIKNDKVIANRILNDVLFCHTNPASISKYILQLMEQRSFTPTGSVLFNKESKYLPISTQENQKSSGLWVGPAAGSTAARKSAGLKPMLLNSPDIQLAVRELYCSPLSTPGISTMIASPGKSIRVISKMESAAMYLDGNYNIVPVGLGDEIYFEKSNENLKLLGVPNVLCR